MCTLEGHTDNVRTIDWNYEIASLLLSGGWDGTIRLWDIYKKRCLRVVSDHSSDIYGIISHPNRPFYYITVSKDSTIRFWLLKDIVRKLLVKFILKRPLNELQYALSLHYDYNSPCLLNKSPLFPQIASGTDYEKYWKIYTYLSGENGMYELWSMVKCNLHRNETPSNSKVIHIRDVSNYLKDQALKFENEAKDNNYIHSSKMTKKQVIVKAANAYIKFGDFEKYCELMINAGEWKKALMVAPKVSKNYWMKLCTKYSNYLEKTDNEDVIPYYIISKSYLQLLQYLYRHGLYEESLLLHCMYDSEEYKAINSETLRLNKIVNTDSLISLNLDLKTNFQVEKTVELLSSNYFNKGEPFLGAAWYLAINNTKKALQILSDSGEVELAYILSLIFLIPLKSLTLDNLCKRLSSLGYDKEACQIYSNMNSKKFLLQFCGKCACNKELAKKIFSFAGYRSPESYKDSAESAMKENDLQSAINCYILCADTERAITIGVQLINQYFKTPTWNWAEIRNVIYILHSADASILPDSLKGLYLCYCSFFGLIEAIWLLYTPIIQPMYNNLLKLIKKYNINFPVKLEIITSIVNQYNNRQSHQYNESHRRCAIIVYGNEFPTRCPEDKLYFFNERKRSLIGPIYLLNDKYVITLQEALMWMKVNPYSPLNTGERLNQIN